MTISSMVNTNDLIPNTVIDNSTAVRAILMPDIGLENICENLFADRIRRRFLIGRSPNICSGSPIISGTRISVVNIIEKALSGLDVERVHLEYPHLKKDEILACLEYYEDNKIEIDELLELEKEIESSSADFIPE